MSYLLRLVYGLQKDPHQKQYEELPAESLTWSNVITQMGDIVEQASVLEIESQAIEVPNIGVGRKVIQIALRAIENLNLLRHDILSRDYKRLWTIRRYGNSIEGKWKTIDV